MRLLGLAGPSGSGKNEAARQIRSEGWLNIAFADPLREMLYTLNPAVGVEFPNQPLRLQKVIDDVGWDGYKKTPYNDEIRRLIQTIGTECGRGIIGENVWVDSLFRKVDRFGRYVITDVRFPNEAQAIRDRGGQVWWISRADQKPINDHISERAINALDCDNIIFNDGTPAMLGAHMMAELRKVLVN